MSERTLVTTKAIASGPHVCRTRSEKDLVYLLQRCPFFKGTSLDRSAALHH
jgi:hypothetical protein